MPKAEGSDTDGSSSAPLSGYENGVESVDRLMSEPFGDVATTRLAQENNVSWRNQLRRTKKLILRRLGTAIRLPPTTISDLLSGQGRI